MQALRFLTAAVMLAGPAAAGPAGPARPNRWDRAIRAFEQLDAKDPPPKNAVLFVGSSSIRGWDTKRWFPRVATIQRGFGGSHVSDSLHFANRIVLPYAPRIVVMYAGDNDIAAGKTPRRVLDDYKAFVRRIHDALPKTRIVYIAIKPSIARWKLVGKMRQANALIEAFTRTDDRLRYVDVDRPMIGPDGRPRKELFRSDGLHLNDEGYRLWTSLVAPHLGPPAAAGQRTLVDAGEPFGRLPLVDEVLCGDPNDPHALLEDPSGASRVRTILSRPCRVLDNDGGAKCFGYRLGRGRGLTAGAAYLLSVEFPEDEPRTMFLINRGCETARGFCTGPAVGDVLYTYTNNNVESLKLPLSREYRTWRMLFFLHDRFPDASQPRGVGQRPSAPADGFCVFVAHSSRKNAPLSRGPAVSRIRLFELPDPAKLYLKLNLPPSPLPRRGVFFREEMSDGVIAGTKDAERGVRKDVDFFEHKARLMKLLGMNVFCKDLLEFGHNQGWDASDGGGNDWYWANKHPNRWRGILEMLGRYDFRVLPYYEWAGSVGRRGLGRTKKCVSLNGQKTYTHITWSEKFNADITDPEALADAIKLLDATIVRHKDKVSFLGAWFRTRPSHIPMSFSDRCLRLFEKETRIGRKITRQAIKDHPLLRGKYYDWWFEKRKAFLTALRDHLRSNVHDEAIVLFTPEAAEPGPPIHGFKARLVTDDVETWRKVLSQPEHGKITAYDVRAAIAGDEHLAAVLRPRATWGKWEWQHSIPQADPQRYAETPGVLLSLPFNRAYTVSGPKAFDTFRGPSGLAIVRHYPLNEHVLEKKLGYFVSDVERAGPYCMLAEARAMAYGNPRYIGYLAAASFNRGFPAHVRAFNAAFLALPYLPAETLKDACSDGDVVVRAMATQRHGTYLAVVNVALTAKKDVTITLPKHGRITDAAMGTALGSPRRKLRLSLGPCQLRAFHVR